MAPSLWLTLPDGSVSNNGRANLVQGFLPAKAGGPDITIATSGEKIIGGVQIRLTSPVEIVTLIRWCARPVEFLVSSTTGITIPISIGPTHDVSLEQLFVEMRHRGARTP